MDTQLDQAPGGYLRFGDDGSLIQVNATLARLLGYAPEALVGRRIETILSLAGRIFYQTHFYPLLRLSGRADEIYLSLRTVDGEDLPVLINAVRREPEGVTDCLLIPMRQRSHYEEQLLRAKRAAEDSARAKDQFLAVVSHELRTPLNAILGWTEMLLGDELDAGEVRRALQVIEQSARMQADLIEDLLDVSRITAGTLRMDVMPVALEAPIAAAIETLSLAAEARRIAIDFVPEPDVGQVSGDSARLQQVIWNLLSNALKFTPPGGRISLRLRRIGTEAVIEVCDTGRGIAPEFLPFVFEPFRQEDGSYSRSQNGLGLGLAIVRRLVELHGGEIEVSSPGLNQGCTFTVCLPLRQPLEADSQQDASQVAA